MYCLDTDVIINYNKGNKQTVEKIQENWQNIFTTPLNVCELFKGVEFSSHPEKDLLIVEETIRSMKILDLNMQSAKTYASDFKFLKEKGKPIEEFDMLISAIAKSYDCILVTRNKKHFENIPNLKIEEW